jgi:hypothetical protein
VAKELWFIETADFMKDIGTMIIEMVKDWRDIVMVTSTKVNSERISLMDLEFISG